MWKVLQFCGLGFLLAQPLDAHDQEFCAKLNEFETAPLDETSEEKARWVEMHWTGSWLNFETGWGITCVSSDDDAAKSFCEWLPGNSSYEFAHTFPRKILECHGYAVPRIENWKGTVEISDAEDRFHQLVIDFATLEGQTGAVRYVSVSDETAGGTDIEHTPLRPLDERQTAIDDD